MKNLLTVALLLASSLASAQPFNMGGFGASSPGAASAAASSSVTANSSQFSGTGDGSSPLTLRSSSVTLQGNTFNGASQLVQAQSDGSVCSYFANPYPAVCLQGSDTNGFLAQHWYDPSASPHFTDWLLEWDQHQFNFINSSGTLLYYGQETNLPTGYWVFTGTVTASAIGIGTTVPAFPLDIVYGKYNNPLGMLRLKQTGSGGANMLMQAGCASCGTLIVGSTVPIVNLGDITQPLLVGAISPYDASIGGGSVGSAASNNITWKFATGNVGIGTDSPASLFQVAGGTFAVTQSGLFKTAGQKPSASSCNSQSANTGSNYFRGSVTFAGGAQSACTLTFQDAGGLTPFCVCGDATTVAVAPKCLAGAGTLAMSIAVAANDTITYICGW